MYWFEGVMGTRGVVCVPPRKPYWRLKEGTRCGEGEKGEKACGVIFVSGLVTFSD